MAVNMDAQKAIGQTNRLGVLRYIRDHDETTRYDIATHLKLSQTTVKTYIDALLTDGLIEQVGTAPSIGGRKPMVFRLVPNARYSLGANFAPGRIDLLLLNLKREVIDRRSLPIVNGHFEQALDKMAQVIDQMVQSLGIQREKILGLGMTFPGLVDDTKSLLLYLANLGVKNFSLKPFETRIGLEVFAENEAQAAANAERILGLAKGKDNLVYISVAEGIGVGLVINGQIYRSSGKNAGEFGHVRVSDQPVACNCGRTGCWELFASSKALVQNFRDSLGDSTATLEQLFADYTRHEPVAISVLEQYARDLFKGIDIILLAYSPEEVIIGGDLAIYADTILDIGINKLGLTRGFQGYENTRIAAAALQADAALMGAALLPTDRDAFADPISASLSSI